MVSPSATPITLPDQAQEGQGSTSKKITARHMTEVIRLGIDLSSSKTRIILALVPPPAERTDYTEMNFTVLQGYRLKTPQCGGPDISGP
jgi:hypothetical protein